MIYAEVIGDPVSHSKSPLIHTFWLEKLRLEGDFRKTRVKAAGLEDYLASCRADTNWRGCSVTIPHKRSVIAFLDAVEDPAIGAVNCIVPEGGSLIGRNTDVAGIAEALGSIATDAPIAIIGAGGAARAALASLQRLGASEVRIIARDARAGEALLNSYSMAGAVLPFEASATALDACGGAINASPLGMNGYPAMHSGLIRALDKMAPEAFAFDMVYDPLRTAFLDAAEEPGYRAIDGLAMLIGQAASAFRFFFGADAPRQHDRELRERLTK